MPVRSSYQPPLLLGEHKLPNCFPGFCNARSLYRPDYAQTCVLAAATAAALSDGAVHVIDEYLVRHSRKNSGLSVAPRASACWRCYRSPYLNQWQSYVPGYCIAIKMVSAKLMANADIHRQCCGRAGGRGAIISGLFRLDKGWRMSVLCGGMSRMGPQGNSGGGGGTYVMVENEDEPLIVAGGGGGTRSAQIPSPHIS